MADAKHAELPFRSRKKAAKAAPGAPAQGAAADKAPSNRKRRTHPNASAVIQHDGEGLVFMVTNIDEEATGRFHLWGVTPAGQSVLVRINDFRPYFLIAAPVLQGEGESGSGLTTEALDTLTQLLNRSVPSDSRIASLTPEKRTPIMFYRPNSPDQIPALKVTLTQGASLRKASSAVHKTLKSDVLPSNGFEVRDSNLYEHEVHLLQRFLVDASVSGGAWMYIPNSCPAADSEAGAQAGFTAAQQRASNAAIEVDAPWSSLRCLTPDATQLADADWQPQAPPGLAGSAAEQWRSAAASAAAGDIAALRLLTMDVVLSPSDGQDRVPVASQDPIVAITCVLHSSGDAAMAAPAEGQAGLLRDDNGLDDAEDGEDGNLADQSAAGAVPETGGSAGSVSCHETPGVQEKVVFLYERGCETGELAERVHCARVHRFPSEMAMLRAWKAWLLDRDPDAFVLFEVKDTLAAVQERFKALKLDGGGLPISRLQGMHAKPVSIKKVTQYSANWVKSQSRMSSTSNQETWRADIAGRVVFDLLRQILTACNLASFSLVDACQSLLGRRLEVLPPSVTAALAGLVPPPQLLTAVPYDADAGAMRLAAYSATRAAAVFALLGRMSILAESVELARATGLTLANVLYNAQMIRTWSLLLRNAQRLGYMVSGRVDPQQLQESPYLMHPVEAGTTGLYRTPVCILDFASLYPSLFRAYNLCYTTLLHPDDVANLPADDIITTPTGDQFVKPSVRKGVLPSILAALIQARSATKALLKEAPDPARRAVLDSRQKALKLCANALYGFTGAQTSMLQCLPLADSCLAMGAASTRRAVDTIHELAADGKLGPKGSSARVIYGQTDSVFVHLPDCTAAEAVTLGQQIGSLASQAFPPEMKLAFEKVLSPFLLLHVNRYAGRAYESTEEVAGGRAQLLVKGLKSMWRMAPGILRSTLGGAVHRIILDDDVEAAVAWVEHEVRRLLSGGCELWELVMTGGLWRVTGSQVAAAAEGGGEEMRGPHAALAARLAQRDPGRSFVLGERIQYVLLPGTRLQDDASEDPLTAARAGATGAAELYWKQKMVPSIKEVFATCLSSNALQALLTGPHTTVREDPAFTGAQAAPTSGKDGGRQTALKTFFRSKVRCLGGCRRTVDAPPGGVPPPLCSFCAEEEGKAAEVWISLTDRINEVQRRQRLALSTCVRCHSGGMMGPVACENGECPVLFSRLAATKRLDTLLKAQERLDDW